MKFPPGWGGKRKGAGRKRRGPQTVAHRARPEHQAAHPVHVTWRVVRRVGNLRRNKLARIIGLTIRTMNASWLERGRAFRVIHFSIQPDHLHLIVEGGDKSALIAGLRGLAVWIARRVNQALGTRGRVFASRYHATVITKPRQMRYQIVYVLQNHKHHQPSRYLVDEFSSARWFPHWEHPLSQPATPSPVLPPTTWLADEGWRKFYPPISFDEEPT